MVLGKRNGISFDGIAIIILLTFLPHTLKFQNPRFCGVSLGGIVFLLIKIKKEKGVVGFHLGCHCQIGGGHDSPLWSNP
jgi:hypothetical protein